MITNSIPRTTKFEVAFCDSAECSTQYFATAVRVTLSETPVCAECGSHWLWKEGNTQNLFTVAELHELYGNQPCGYYLPIDLGVAA